MKLLPLPTRQRVVGDPPDEVLEESVLAVLRRPGVGVEREHLLAHERREERLELGLRGTGEACQRGLRERLA